MTPVVTLANAQFFRGSGWWHIWLVREEEIKFPLEVWVPRHPFIWPARSPYPQAKPRDTELQKTSHIHSQTASCPQGQRTRAHTHTLMLTLTHMVI